MIKKNISADAIFVVHVKQGYEDRERHINHHLPSRGLVNFEYMLEGDISDLSKDIIEKHFYGIVTKSDAAMSCAYKHFLIYQQIVERGLKSALILEDDIFLDKKFVDIFNCSVEEVSSHEAAFVSFERSGNYVPFFVKKIGKCLYQSKKNKMTGAYYINAEAAYKFYHYMLKNRCYLPVDWMITEMSQSLALPIYWCEPTVAEQGSKNGSFSSELSGKIKGSYQRLRWLLNRLYKQYVYSNISMKNLSNFR